jgi:hypothetical protein
MNKLVIASLLFSLLGLSGCDQGPSQASKSQAKVTAANEKPIPEQTIEAALSSPETAALLAASSPEATAMAAAPGSTAARDASKQGESQCKLVEGLVKPAATKQ